MGSRCPVITFKAPEQVEKPGTNKNARKKYKPRVDNEYCNHICVANASHHRNKDKKKRVSVGR